MTTTFASRAVHLNAANKILYLVSCLGGGRDAGPNVASGRDFQLVTLGHYVSVTDANYAKMYQVSRIIMLLAEGARDDQFCIATYSSYIYATRSSPPRHSGSLLVLEFKGSSAVKFLADISPLA